MRRIIIFALSALIGISIGIAALPAFWLVIGQHANFLNQTWSNGLIGAILFLFFAALLIQPLLRLLAKIDARMGKINLSKLIYNLLGAIIGLIVGVLISLPLMILSIPVLSQIAPFIVIILMMYLGYTLFDRRGRDVLTTLFRRNVSSESGLRKQRDAKLLDTSAIIDGRVFDILKTGFLDGQIIIPNFVLLELQTLADSGDDLKRAKGRRGLDYVNEIKKNKNVQISKKDYSDIHEVDTKLLRYASEIGAKLVTTDFNLNKVAEIQGVVVLNINDLANAVRAQLVSGETMRLEILRKGTERKQGIGYLPDGTMVVVEDTDHLIGKTVTVEVVKVLQTSAGRMIFAEFKN
ncbi:MAG: TRAM domain-containing protein [Streptococcaceae bacterium]|jgi:uncharacterized protein YacL|nr:TRAM domain-containing protein [Streptococcaceae bacterium]